MTSAEPPAPSAPSHATLHVRGDRHGVVVERAADGAALRCDAEGRWTTLHRSGGVLRRAVDGRVHVRRPGGDEALPSAEADAVHDLAARAAAEFAAAIERGDPVDLVGDRAHALALLRAAAGRGAAWFAGEARRAAALYPEGIPILPPHRYRDVVVDPARGCPNGGCTFCAFYKDRPFEVLDDAAFRAHLDAVRAHFGRALDAVDGVFLGSASAASIPDAVLLRRLADVAAAFGPRARGVAAFLDPDHAPRRDAARWTALRTAGLGDVTVGLETGLAPLRAEVGKRADLDRFVADVAAMKAAGLKVAVTVLLGLGGPARAEAHRDATVATLAAMPLDAKDLVYLSPLRGSMPPDALAAEDRLLRAALVGRTRARATPYPAEAFVART